MADLNRVAKRIHNISPEPVELTLADGSTGIFRFSSTEFFQQEFQAEGSREGDEAAYRLITSEDNASVLVGRKLDDGWGIVGEAVEAERAGSGQ